MLRICYHGFQERDFYFLAKAGDDVIIWCGLHSNYQHMNTALIKEEIKHVTDFKQFIICPWLITFIISCVWGNSEELQTLPGTVQICVQPMVKGNQKCHGEMLRPLGQVPLLRCPPWPAAPIPGCSSRRWHRCVCTHQHPSCLTLTTAFEEDISMLHFPSNFLSSALHTIQAWPEENKE